MLLPAAVLEAVYRHAEADYPYECCGALWLVHDAQGERWEVMPCVNIQNELHAQDPRRFPRDARTAYTIAPRELLAINRRAEEDGQTLAVLYHSHPDHAAYFSQEDLAFAAPFGEPAYPGTTYMVISVRQGKVQGHRCFHWNETSSGYEDVTC